MTIGQRIAQKRKERALSQEALGETLGVSRQSIYKWESDAALPEIDKLIALSRLFGVSVGWLLGVEADAPPEVPALDGELTEAQLKMVEEIVGRYIAAQPAPKKRRKWPYVLAAAVLFCALTKLFNQFDILRMENESLQNNISRVERSVDSQINGISARVEEILKAQNGLTADYGAELTARSLSANTVTFDVYAVPKTYVDGMTAQFCADNGAGGAVYVDAALAGEKFTATVSTELTDSIALSVVFASPDGTRQTQLLDQYSGLYTESMPEADIGGGTLIGMKLAEPGTLVFGEDSHERYVWIRGGDPTTAAAVQIGPGGEPLTGPAEIAGVRVGLFKNQRLAAWAKPCEKPDSFHGFEDCTFYRLPTLELSLTPADTVQLAAVVEDVHGRTAVCPGLPYCPDAEGRLVYSDHVITLDTDLKNWKLV